MASTIETLHDWRYRLQAPRRRSRSRRLAMVVLGMAGVVALDQACKSDLEVRVETCQSQSCGDTLCPVRSCDSDEGCPVGTRCDGKECRPPRLPTISNQTLLKGFETDELVLARDEAETFRVEVPKGTEYALCGLFVAPPQFKSGALTNASSSIARFRVFPVNKSEDVSAFVLRLDDLQPLSTGDCLSSFLDDDNPRIRLVESLHLGCWAINTDRVSAASLLITIDPTEIPEYHVAVLASCDQSSAPTEGKLCTLPPQAGVCLNQKCVEAESRGVGNNTLDFVATCALAVDGSSCKLMRFERGRCFAGGCVAQALELPLLVAECSDDVESFNCFPSPLGTIGTCLGEFCRARCYDSKDCEGATTSASPTCQRHKPNSYLGVCTNSEDVEP